MVRRTGTTGRRWPRAAAATALAGAAVLAGVQAPAWSGDEPARDGAAQGTPAWVGGVEVVREVGARRAVGADGEPVLRGRVFRDDDRDSASGRDAGVRGVRVSNGRDVVVTDRRGRYELPAYEGMTVFVTEPRGWDVPVDEDGVAQFHYHHLPLGSPPLRFGGLAPTGPLPSAVNFPLARDRSELQDDSARCAVLGDVQTYSHRELGYARDGAVAELAATQGLDECGALLLGDVAGDDLGLYPRIKDVVGEIGAPVRFVVGNHDLDFDATTDEHSADTFKRELGPTYYSYDVADTHVVVLDNVRYPCTPEVDDADGAHSFCADPVASPQYNGRIGEEQLTWLAADLARVPQGKQVVVATHIPLVSFADRTSTKHQTDDVLRLYELLEGRPALALSGHTHSLENLQPGDAYDGWQQAVGVESLPFPHIVAGAVSGDWYSGDLDIEGRPMALQRDGARPGYLVLDVDGAEHQETYKAVGEPVERQMAVSLNSPRWRSWYEQLVAFADERDAARRAAEDTEDPADDAAAERMVPPVNVNDLGDPELVTPEDLAGGTWLVANVWNGTTATDVTVSIDGGEPVAAQRTQEARGEQGRVGAEWADPAAATRQLQVGRYSLESTSGNEEAQGHRLFRGSQYGPGPTQPGNNVADQAHHIWRVPLPADLGEGVYTAEVRATDQYGRAFVHTETFEVRPELPRWEFRTELFEDGQ